MVFRQIFKLAVRGELPLVHREKGLENTGRSGRSQQVPDLGFNGGNTRIRLSVDGVQRLEFSLISDNGGGPVGFNKTDILGTDPLRMVSKHR